MEIGPIEKQKNLPISFIRVIPFGVRGGAPRCGSAVGILIRCGGRQRVPLSSRAGPESESR